MEQLLCEILEREEKFNAAKAEGKIKKNGGSAERWPKKSKIPTGRDGIAKRQKKKSAEKIGGEGISTEYSID